MTSASAIRSDPVRTTITAPQQSTLQINAMALVNAEAFMSNIADSIPSASDAIKKALFERFMGAEKYVSLDKQFGPQWPSNIDVVINASNDTSSPGSEFQLVHVNPVTGDISTPPVLNDVEMKRELAASFFRCVMNYYNADQGTYWSGITNGSERSKALQGAMRAALQAEAGIRVGTSTLSAKAYLITREVWERGRLLPADATPDQSLRPDQAGTDVSRLTLHGEDVLGAFVFTQHGTRQEDGVAVLWRPGRPLQEFSSVQALRKWVAGEQVDGEPRRAGAGIDAVGTRAVSEEVFALRAQDLRRHRAGALTQALGETNISSLKAYVDQVTDAGTYLDLLPAWDGEVTEGLRSNVSGPTAPAQVMQWEQARQTARESALRLQSEVETIPDLKTYARNKIIEQLAKDHPGMGKVDPDKTIVHATVESISRITVLVAHVSRVKKDYTLTEYVLRNTPVWQGLSTLEYASAALVDNRGEPLLGQDGKAIKFDTKAVETLARTLDVGKHYTDMLLNRYSASFDPARQGRLQALWMAAVTDKLHAERIKTSMEPAALETLKWQSAEDPGLRRALRYIDAVIDHPDPRTRPTVDGHKIVANQLILGAANSNGGGGQVINGVAVIGTSDPRSSPAVVLYTPDAPDAISFRELADIGDLDLIYRDPAWKRYFTERMTTSDRGEAEKILSGSGSVAGRTVLRPIQGDFYAGLYESSVGFLVAHAQHRSTTNSQVSARSTLNQALLAYEVVTTLATMFPPAGVASLARRGIAGLATRLRQFRPGAFSTGSKGGIGSFKPLENLPLQNISPSLSRRTPASGSTESLVSTTSKGSVSLPLRQAPESTPLPLRSYVQSEDLVKTVEVSDSTIDRGIYQAANGRRYINLAKGPESPALVAEVVPVGNRIWQVHLDGAPAGPFVKYDAVNGQWSILHDVQFGPVRSKWGPPATVEFSPSNTSPVIYRNLNPVPAGFSWRAEDVINMAEVARAMNAEFSTGVRESALTTTTGRELASKMEIPFDENNLGANPAAWTSPEGKIYIASDSPDYVVDGVLDVDKVRSTVVHEYVHSVSANQTGLQQVTLNHGEVGLSPLNFDEAFVDHFAHQLYEKLYPGRPYKSGYFLAQGTLWMGETVNFIEASGAMTRKQMSDALFKDPSLFKPLADAIKREWQAWGKSGPRVGNRP